MKTHTAIAIIALGLWPNLAQAADEAANPLTIGATVRLRTESISGQFRATGPANDTMVSLKTAVDAEYDAGPVRFGGELWDARSWGQDRSSSAGTSEVNALELVQANVKIELGAKSLLTLGRFTLDLAGRRLVSRQRFRNTTNAFTGAHLALVGSGGRRLDALLTMPHTRLPSDSDGIRSDRVQWDRESTDVLFFGAQATLPSVAGGVLQPYAYGLTERDSPALATRNRRLWTVGARLFKQPKAGTWDHDIEATVQGGKARRTTAASDRADLDVAAWFLHAELGKTLSASWKPRLAVLFDAASGDGGKAGKYSRFDTLYGARRFEFGPNGLYGPFARANMISPSLRLEVTPTKRTDAFVAWRSAWAENQADTFAATGVRDASDAAGTLAGHQVEARVRHWIMPGHLQIDVGGAMLLKRGLLRDAANAPASGNTRYGYVDLLLTL
ncbi:alginate export family protein [Novosphingobium sp. SL115]|uniref:alginate export family protein n=1 Tax=Novosphingobium sp. SL115 TaxID=2995150 RepID=UPI002272A67C|nr:alginate export family protein [Novosphingobium sp. SL115]MCY1670465.1 alginate export family protein [Novosphingobium sp. SL115]